MAGWLIELRFSIPLGTKWVILEMQLIVKTESQLARCTVADDLVLALSDLTNICLDTYARSYEYFWILFVATEANKNIHTDDPTWYQLF